MGLPKYISEDGNDKLLRPILAGHRARLEALEGAPASSLASDAPVPVYAGVTWEDDFVRSYDVVGDGSVFLCDHGPVIKVLAGTGTVAFNRFVGGDPEAPAGYIQASGPAGTGNTARARLANGTDIIDTASVVAADYPKITLSALCSFAVAEADAQAYFGLFWGNAAPVPGTTVGIHIEGQWNTDHIEHHGRVYDGSTYSDIPLYTSPVGSFYKWARAVLEFDVTGTVTFYTSTDGETWVEAGAVTGLAVLPFQDLVYAVLYGGGGTTAQGTARLDWFRLDWERSRPS